MDAVGSEQAALAGWYDASPLCMLFAATFPERTAALVLGSAIAKFTPDAEFPYGSNLGPLGDRGAIEDSWGEGVSVALHSPTAAADQRFMDWWCRYERLAASPASAAAFLEMSLDIDVRSVLSTIRVPTLVLHRTGERLVPIESGRWVAGHIPGAVFVELPGVDTLPYVGDWEQMAGEIEQFLTGTRRPVDADRVLATVLFTDIVGSTEQAAQLGDRRWRELLDRHDEVIRGHITEFRGRQVKTMGDGVLATFDGPGRAVRCACAVRDGLRGLGIEVRAGLHTGEVEVLGDDVGGIAVHIGQRVSALAGPGEVLVSRTVVDLVAGSGIDFVDRGEHQLKGVKGSWHLFAVAA
jgi:class 3 adenylate cyclase